MFINHDRKWVFLHSPKCGGTSMGHWLRRHWPDEWVEIDRPDDLARLVWRGTEYVTDRRHSWIPPEACADYRRFTTTREPIERFASWYRFLRTYKWSGVDLSLSDFAIQHANSLTPQDAYVANSHVVLPLGRIRDHLCALPWCLQQQPVAWQFPQDNATEREPGDVWTPEALELVRTTYARDYAATWFPPPD